MRTNSRYTTLRDRIIHAKYPHPSASWLMRWLLPLGVVGALLWGGGSAWASGKETRVMVRVLAKDAKFVGSGMGGMRVQIADAKTGEILSQGKILGGTGPTAHLMKRPWRRGVRLSDEKTAGFLAKLHLTKPRLVEIRAYGPLAYPASAVSVRTQLWLLPGVHLEGDGVILVAPGLVVELLPTKAVEKGVVRVQARVRMMCGCPIQKGSAESPALWPQKEFQVRLRWVGPSKQAGTVTMTFVKTNTFEAKIPIKKAGLYRLEVAAHQTNGNVGWIKVKRLFR